MLLDSLSGDHSVKFCVLALDDQTAEVFGKSYPDVMVVRQHELMSFRPELAAALIGRNFAEQLFTMGPTFLEYCAKLFDDVDWVVYADSDLRFYSPLSKYLGAYIEYSTVLTPHRHYFWNRKRLAKYGNFNVGLVPFNLNRSGGELIAYWATACRNWCFDRPENGKYADQGYLEAFEKIAPGEVYIEKSLGANLAPWNSWFVRVERLGRGEYQVDGQSLIYFHFQGLKYFDSQWQLGHLNYLSLAPKGIRLSLYEPYLQEMLRVERAHSLPNPHSSRESLTSLGRFAATLLRAISVVLGQTLRVSDKK